MSGRGDEGEDGVSIQEKIVDLGTVTHICMLHYVFGYPYVWL